MVRTAGTAPTISDWQPEVLLLNYARLVHVPGIEPRLPIWKKGGLPLAYTCKLELPRRTARRSPDYKTSASLFML